MITYRNLPQIAEILNFSEEEVMELVRQHRIPYLVFKDDRGLQFVEEEVLAAITPRPRKVEEIFPTREPTIELEEPGASAGSTIKDVQSGPVASLKRGRKPKK